MCLKFYVLLFGPDIAKIAEGNKVQEGKCRLVVTEDGGMFSVYHHMAEFPNGNFLLTHCTYLFLLL